MYLSAVIRKRVGVKSLATESRGSRNPFASLLFLESPLALSQASAQTQTTPNAPAGAAKAPAWGQHVQQNDAAPKVPNRTDMLRGAYGPFRANNDLLYYQLVMRVNPDQKTLSGENTIRFRMLQDGSRIQLDLQEPLQIDKILMGTGLLKYERDTSAVFIHFPQPLRAGQVYSIDFFYSGKPVSAGRFGGITFGQGSGGWADNGRIDRRFSACLTTRKCPPRAASNVGYRFFDSVLRPLVSMK